MQKLSDNVTHSQNLTILTAAVTLGTEAVMRALGSETEATTLDETFLTEADIQTAITARICKHLG